MSFNFNIGNLNKPKVDLDQIFDFVSIGGGPASYNASLYAKRKGLNVLIIAKKPGGQLLNTSSVDRNGSLNAGYRHSACFRISLGTIEEFPLAVFTLALPSTFRLSNQVLTKAF